MKERAGRSRASALLGPGLTVPEALGSRLVGYRIAFEQKNGSTRVYRLEKEGQAAVWLKLQEDPQAWQSLALERFALHRLRGSKLPVPQPLEYLRVEEIEYLVSSAIEGRNLVDHLVAGTLTPQAAVEIVAAAIARIHATRPRWPEGINTLASRLEIARTRVRSGLVDATRFSGSWAGWTAARLLTEVEERWTDERESAFVHGDLCLPNMLASDGALSGIVDWGRAGFGAPYQDIGLAIRSLEHNLGSGDWDRRLAEACGIELDPDQVEFWRMFDDLL